MSGDRCKKWEFLTQPHFTFSKGTQLNVRPLAAICARDVMMITRIIGEFVISGIFTKIDAMHDVIFGQYVDRAINGHHVDAGILHLQFVKNIFYTEWFLCSREKFHNPYSRDC